MSNQEFHLTLVPLSGGRRCLKIQNHGVPCRLWTLREKVETRDRSHRFTLSSGEEAGGEYLRVYEPIPGGDWNEFVPQVEVVLAKSFPDAVVVVHEA